MTIYTIDRKPVTGKAKPEKAATLACKREQWPSVRSRDPNPNGPGTHGAQGQNENEITAGGSRIQ